MLCLAFQSCRGELSAGADPGSCCLRVCCLSPGAEHQAVTIALTFLSCTHAEVFTLIGSGVMGSHHLSAPLSSRLKYRV